MLQDFPFSKLSNDELLELLGNNSAECIENVLSNCEFRECLYKLRKDETLNSLSCAYYSTDQFNVKFRKSLKNIELFVLHLNIRSLNSKVRALQNLLCLLDCEPDALIISEIWSVNIQFYQNIFDGYCLFADLPTHSKVGGVGLFVKKSLCPILRPDLNINLLNNQKIEQIWVHLSKNNRKYVIGGLYRHPNQPIDDFINMFEPTLNKISKGKTPCIIATDVNINFLKTDTDNNTAKYLHSLLAYNFLPTILLPTRVTSNSATLIDHIYFYEGDAKNRDFNVFSGNLLSDISDHYPNFFILTNSKCMIPLCENRPLIRLFTSNNKVKFQQKCTEIDWENVLYSCDDVNICYNKFVSLVKNVFENCFPLVRKSRRAYRDKKWISAGIKISSKTKDMLFNRWRSTKSSQDETNYKNYKKIYS